MTAESIMQVCPLCGQKVSHKRKDSTLTQVNIKITKSELEAIDRLALANNLNRSEMVRRIIKNREVL